MLLDRKPDSHCQREFIIDININDYPPICYRLIGVHFCFAEVFLRGVVNMLENLLSCKVQKNMEMKRCDKQAALSCVTCGGYCELDDYANIWAYPSKCLRIFFAIGSLLIQLRR